MTLEAYEKASDIMKRIDSLDKAIYDLKDIMRNDTAHWCLEVRPNTSYPLRAVNHYGILPEVLQEILSRHLAERKELTDELAKL
jgi:hypothetical protein